MIRFWSIWLVLSLWVGGNPRLSRAETLQDAWAIAVATNAELSAVQLEQQAADWDWQASRALRLPNASVQSAYTVRSDTPSFQSSVPGFTSFPFAQREAASAKGEVQAPLYTSGRIKNAILAAQAKLAIAIHDTEKTRLDLLLQIGEAYLAVLRDQSDWDVAQQDVATRTAHEKEVQSLFQQSRVPKNDLLSAQVTTAAAVQHRLRVQHRIQNSRAAYNQLLGRSLQAKFTLLECALPWLSYTSDELELLAWQRHPELLKIQAAVDAKYFESQRLLAKRKPQLSAVGSVQYEENRFQDPQSLASAAVVLDWNLFDGGRGKRTAQAELTRAASLRRLLANLRSQVGLELLTISNAREEASQRRELAVRTLQQADESLRVSQLRYTRGLAVNSEVLDAQSRRIQVMKDLHHANYDLVLAQLRLRHAAGILSITGE